eukprot:TRINITY_DN11063_c0_g1_i1.p1 TRINITY_DN11063_c0_g1~~TRINITY_DN11063_c0_g1_i1.p1  ORF type:complete len:359 (-),score=77.01 TRINITY_DN11063_c0_g1_i1:99-1175(-)
MVQDWEINFLMIFVMPMFFYTLSMYPVQQTKMGKNTKGYNPINDIEWLDSEIRAWIFKNLWKKWGGIVRRHTATKSTAVNTFSLQLSGYGSRQSQVQEALDRMGVKEPAEIDKWDEAKVKLLVETFVRVRFPTIFVLNKIDHPDADSNIMKICEKYGEDHVVLSSALSECFLRKMVNGKYIRYTPGDAVFTTAKDEEEYPPDDPNLPKLKLMDGKLEEKVEKIRDLVLFRYGSTGIQEAIKKAVEVKGYTPLYPVKNIKNFTSSERGRGVFRDCILIPPGTTVKESAALTHPDLGKYFAYAEGISGKRIAEDEIVTLENNILKFVTSHTEDIKLGGDKKKNTQPTTKSKPKEPETKNN